MSYTINTEELINLFHIKLAYVCKHFKINIHIANLEFLKLEQFYG